MAQSLIWSSEFLVSEFDEPNDAWSLEVHCFGADDVRILAAQPGRDIQKQFASVIGAYAWLLEFARSKCVTLEPTCEFDFRDIVY